MNLLWNKANVIKFQKMKSYIICSKHNESKLEINKKHISEKVPNIRNVFLKLP